MKNLTITKLAGRPLATSVMPGALSGGVVRVMGTGVPAARCAALSAPASREAVSERPTQAPADAVVSLGGTVPAYVTAGVGAGHQTFTHQIFGQQKTQLHTMWALRGLDPWSDPA